MRHAIAVAVLFLFAVGSLSAATFEPVSDAALVDRADLVVVAQVLDSSSHRLDDGLIVTETRLLIEEALKGAAGGTIVVTEAGGSADGLMMVIPGSAEYAPGSRVIAFLERRANGTLRTASMALGAFSVERRPDGIEIATRRAEGASVDDAFALAPRRADSFIRFIRDVARGFDTEPVAALAAPSAIAANAILNIPADSYAMIVGPDGGPFRPARWSECGPDPDGCLIAFRWNGDQGGAFNEAKAVDEGTKAWRSTSLSNGWYLVIANGNQLFGLNSGYPSDGINSVLFNNSTSQTPNIGACDASGTIACGIIFINGSVHSYDGKDWYSIVEGDAVIRPNAVSSQTALEAIVAHELGHTVGLRHSNESGRTPSTTSALMNSSVPMGSGASLRQWDDDAMTEIYGLGIECVPPESVTVCCAAKVAPGTTKSLSSSVTGGNGTLSYQWYEGPAGDTSNPLGTTKNITTPPINEPMSFWVKVTGECGSSITSNVVVVEPTTCTEPSITAGPQSQNITTGSVATLSVVASGSTPLTFRWYEGPQGDTSKPVGTNAATFTTPALTTTTSYWVEVENSCGTALSLAATITVGQACTPPSIHDMTPSLSSVVGQSVQLTVVPAGTGPFTYQWYRGESPSVAEPIAGATNPSHDTGLFTAAVTQRYWVKVTGACGFVDSPTIVITVSCGAVPTPEISSPPASHVTLGYDVTWTGNPSLSNRFEFQEARDAAFTQGVRTFTVEGTQVARVSAHSDVTTDTRFFYRVRAFSNCDNTPTPYSTPSSTIVTRPLPETSTEFSITVPEDAQDPFNQAYLVPGFGDEANFGDTFSITTDAPWLTVFPPSGALSAGGTTVQLTVNPALVEVGTTTATVQVTRTQGTTGNVVSNASTSTSLPFGLSKVTPVTPAPRSANPPEGTLIIPAVAHADGIGTRFQSDVRITNTSANPITYEISFTPSAANGTHVGKRTTLTIAAGDTKAFDDIVRAWYGAGVLGELGLGTIEIRPQAGANPLATFAASRTYAVETRGTYGQFIPAIRTQSFIGPIGENALARLSLQQVANNATYRTNLGFVEGSGAPASLLVKLFAGNGQLLQQTTRALPPYGHEQTNMALLFGDVPLNDGRVEVSVQGGSGKATAYASVLDQRTKDPLLVFPVQAGQLASSRFVVPGVAELDNGVSSNFHSDMRLFNAGAAPVIVTLNYFPQRGDATLRPGPIQRTIASGEVLAIDNVLPSLWNLSKTGGSVTVDTPNDASVVVTARTYSRDAANGTYGQFIPGVTAVDAVGVGDRALQLLQLEQSEQYRTNLGLVEVTGNPATVEVIAFKPDSKTSALIHVPLAANEFVQFGRIFQAMGLPTVYNGRISVRAVDGAGRVAAYGSVVDNRTVDPTYVPSQ